MPGIMFGKESNQGGFRPKGFNTALEIPGKGFELPFFQKTSGIYSGCRQHSVGDSFSHAGFEGKESEMNRCDGFIAMFSPPLGHGECGTKPDHPFRRPELAVDAAMEVYGILRRFARERGFEAKAEYSENDLRAILKGIFDKRGPSKRIPNWNKLARDLGIPIRDPGSIHSWAGPGSWEFIEEFEGAV